MEKASVLLVITNRFIKIMRYIGIPKETKIGEKRVALTPQAVQKILDAVPELEVFITKGAGEGAGYSDQEYVLAGARITQSNKETYVLGRDLIVKVKEPTEYDVNLVCDNSNVLSYIHAAALGSVVAPKVQNLIRNCNVKFYGLELLEKKVMDKVTYPGLIPMSEVAGEVAVEYAVAEWYRKNPLKRLFNKKPSVLVFGLGTSGRAAIQRLNKMGITDIIGFDKNPKVFSLVNAMHCVSKCFEMSHFSVFEKAFINDADILIGAVLVPGKEAPLVLDQEYIRNLPIKIAKSKVLVDIAIDQGGCLIQNSPITTHLEPVKALHNKLSLIAVPNLPAAKPEEASKRLSAVLVDYVIDFFTGKNVEVFTKAITKVEDVIIPQ